MNAATTTRRGHLLDMAGLTAAALGASCSRSGPAAPRERPTHDDARLRVAAYGLMAASAHNAQPWQIELVPSGFLLFIDLDRRLPEIDPEGRQTYLSHGTFIEQSVLGAALEGLDGSVDLLPEGEAPEAPTARLSLRPASEDPDPLALALGARSSNKRRFDQHRDPDPASIREVARQAAGPATDVHIVESPEQLRRVGEACVEAAAIEVGSRTRNRETARWFRFGDGEVAARRDGFGLPQAGVTGLERWIAEAIVLPRGEALADPTGAFARGAIDQVREQVDSTRVFLALTSKGSDRRHQLLAGRGYARLQLAATALGLASHPLSQAVEPCPDRALVLRDLRSAIGIPERETLQMLVRIGLAPPTVPSPRRDVAALLRTAG